MGNSRSAPWRTEEGLSRLRAWQGEGLTQAQIAGRMGIGRSTLGAWKKQYPELRAALTGACGDRCPPETADPPEEKPLIHIEVMPLPEADVQTLARESGLLPLSATADEKQLEKLMESALLRRALGCRYATVTSELRKDPVTGENVMTVTKRIDKEVPPDTTAQLFWLKSRFPDLWQDRHADDAPDAGEVLVTFDVDEEENPEEDDWDGEE